MAGIQKKKYYVVWRGVTPGVYETWAECRAQVEGFQGAQYRGYGDRDTAEKAFALPYESAPQSTTKPAKSAARRTVKDPDDLPITPSVAVDAACNMRTGKMEYRGVDTATGRVVFARGPYAATTNNVGEFLALVFAIALFNRPGNEAFATMPIYSDSITALAWVRNRRANTKMESKPENAALRDQIARAEGWLRQHTWKNPVLKWRTELWGEIPADYGRK